MIKNLPLSMTTSFNTSKLVVGVDSPEKCSFNGALKLAIFFRSLALFFPPFSLPRKIGRKIDKMSLFLFSSRTRGKIIFRTQQSIKYYLLFAMLFWVFFMMIQRSRLLKVKAAWPSRTCVTCCSKFWNSNGVKNLKNKWFITNLIYQSL